MNTCASFAALLDGYIDGGLSPEEQVLVENHLKTCPNCADYVADVLAIETEFPTVDEVRLPENFTHSVMAEVAKHPRKAKKKIRWQPFALPAVACLAVMVYVGGDLMPTQEVAVTTSTAAVSTYSAAPETTPSMAETAMESRAVVETVSPQALFGDAEPHTYSQSQVGTFLDSFQATVLDDGSLAYNLNAEAFTAFMAQVAPDGESIPTQETYWVVVTLD